MKLIRKIVSYGKEVLFKWILCPVMSLLPTKDVILMESVPNLADSTYAVFEQMLKHRINTKYKFIWWLYEDSQYLPRIENVEYVRGGYNTLKLRYYECRAKCIISNNRFLLAHNNRQKSYYIVHGSPLKSVVGYYSLPKGIHYLLTGSEEMGKISVSELHAYHAQEVHLGLPRNDAFHCPPREIHDMFDIDFDKMIVWYPTYRQHRTGHSTAAVHAFPILHDTKEAEKLNAFAQANRMLIVIKPHPAQDLSFIKMQSLSHIRMISDQFFAEHQITSYEFVNASAALITDYSSIYYDYLLRDHPIALTWEDIEEYRQDPGFSVDIEEYCKGAYKVYTTDQLIAFLKDVANGVDSLAELRNEACHIANYSNDGKNAERVTDFILKTSGVSV